ncbi:hypothetical protein [Deinococcus sp. UYEF24]
MNDVLGEVGRHLNPVVLRQEEWLGQQNAADGWVIELTDRLVAILTDPGFDLSESACSIGLSEGFPGQSDGQDQATGEESPADNDVGRMVQLEQKELSSLEGLEVFTGGPPEVDFFKVRLRGEMAKPAAVSDTDKQLHVAPPRYILRRKATLSLEHLCKSSGLGTALSPNMSVVLLFRQSLRKGRAL